jgi:hypothetical protein
MEIEADKLIVDGGSGGFAAPENNLSAGVL